MVAQFNVPPLFSLYPDWSDTRASVLLLPMEVEMPAHPVSMAAHDIVIRVRFVNMLDCDLAGMFAPMKRA